MPCFHPRLRSLKKESQPTKVLSVWSIIHGARMPAVAPEPVFAGEFVAFEESNDAIVIRADSASRFVLGSAAKHPHDLVLGNYSVHTTRAALAAGEAEIQRIGNQLKELR